MLRGKAAFVTGGGRGIGRETCLLLASHGADIAVSARNVAECQEVAEEAERLYGVKAIAIPCDVSNEADVEVAAAKAKEALGKIDIVINNAGVMLKKPLSETTSEEWRWVHAVNTDAPFYVTKAFVDDMIARKDGVIINVSSIWGTKGGPDRSAYISSKHAVIGFSKALGEELKGHGIRVNAVCPGPVDTKMTSELGPDLNKEGWLQPIDIAHVITDLCLPKSRAVTASSVHAFGAGSPVGL
ncbi:dehydrogenase [Bhargavaea cecembensis]|uniref:Dehydrogenase n=1 Tax=Bhargavaea cecembensis TaxID=394098 RepID=A0A163FI67_9BACL|nr:SDR family oxidoreductase [Bhargavaea cecembensis]KZE38746.1 dehydrogenase [Bhargavaea cecembensis]